MKNFDYDNFNWKEHFYLDPDSPSGLAWNRETYSLGGNKLETWVGKPAGALRYCKNGDNKTWCIAFQLNSKIMHFKVHRIILALAGVKTNGLIVDHINGISSDNRIENLRAVPLEMNTRNKKLQNNSPYGITGVGCQHDKKGNSYFVARARFDNKVVQKNFPIKKLGIMEAFLAAVEAREAMIAELNRLGYGYTQDHGIRK